MQNYDNLHPTFYPKPIQPFSVRCLFFVSEAAFGGQIETLTAWFPLKRELASYARNQL